MSSKKISCGLDDIVKNAQKTSHNVRKAGERTIETTTYQTDPSDFDKVIDEMKNQIREILSEIKGMTIDEIITKCESFTAGRKETYTKVKLVYGECEVSVKVNIPTKLKKSKSRKKGKETK